MLVRNINGTSDLKCKCGSWLDHWKNFSKSSAASCTAIGCMKTDLVGAHVQKDSAYDNSWYIVPLCNHHNQATATLTISDATILVSANRGSTCGY